MVSQGLLGQSYQKNRSNNVFEFHIYIFFKHKCLNLFHHKTRIILYKTSSIQNNFPLFFSAGEENARRVTTSDTEGERKNSTEEKQNRR